MTDTALRILVTGATGFVGRNVVAELAARGYTDVSVLVRQTSDTSCFEGVPVKHIYGDVTDPISLAAIDDAFDVLIHASGSVQNADEKKLRAVNVEGTYNVCEFARRKCVSRFVYVSSVAVASGNKDVPLTEDLPFAATNRYGQSKLDAEKIVLDFRSHGLPAVIVRPPMIYGEDEPHMFSPLMRLIGLRLLALPNAGRAKLHLCYVRNVAWFIAECVTHPRAVGQTYFVADSDALSGAEVFGVCASALRAPRPVCLPDWLTPLLVLLPFVGPKIRFFVKDRVYSTRKLQQELGLTLPYEARAALTRTARHWLVSHTQKRKSHGAERVPSMRIADLDR